MTEVLITHPEKQHEGRVDAIFEYNESVKTIDWKTYAEGTIAQYDRYQIISNGMLVNYRYGLAEDDFSKNSLEIILSNGPHHVMPTSTAIITVKDAREYVLKSFNGELDYTSPPYPTICKACGYSRACWFYRKDSTDPELRRLFWWRRYRVLKEREITHKNKFLISVYSPDELEKRGVAEFGYKFEQQNDSNVSLIRDEPPNVIFKRGPIRMIGIEKNIPLSACVSCTGSVTDIDGTTVKIRIYSGRIEQLRYLPIALVRLDVDLTKRELQAIDYVHRQRPELQGIVKQLLGRDDHLLMGS